MGEHPTHNLSDYDFRCYGCGRGPGDPLLAEECPTPDGVGREAKRAIERVAHEGVQREFDPARKPVGPIGMTGPVGHAGSTGAYGGPVTGPIGMTGPRRWGEGRN